MIHTVRADGKFVGRCVVQESAFVEQLVAGFIVVGKGDLNLAVLDLSQGDRKRRVPLLEIDGAGAGAGHKGSKGGESELHLCWVSDCGERWNVYRGDASERMLCRWDERRKDGGIQPVLIRSPRVLMLSGMALLESKPADDIDSPSCKHARLMSDMYDQSSLQ
jgi:hypothetical protein